MKSDIFMCVFFFCEFENFIIFVIYCREVSPVDLIGYRKWLKDKSREIPNLGRNFYNSVSLFLCILFMI